MGEQEMPRITLHQWERHLASMPQDYRDKQRTVIPPGTAPTPEQTRRVMADMTPEERAQWAAYFAAFGSGGMTLDVKMFFIKFGFVFVAVVIGTVRNLYVIYADMNIEFALGYCVSHALMGLPIGGLMLGAMFWGIGAAFFGATSRGAGRAMLMLGLCVTAVFLAGVQFNTTGAPPWYEILLKYPQIWSLVWACLLWYGLPWTKFPK